MPNYEARIIPDNPEDEDQLLQEAIIRYKSSDITKAEQMAESVSRQWRSNTKVDYVKQLTD